VIKKIKLKFGKAPNLPSIEIATTPVTVFVGPNNSGKSKVLSEIHYLCTSGQLNSMDVILSAIEFDSFPLELAQEKIKKITLQPNHNEVISSEHLLVGKGSWRNQIKEQVLLNALQNTNNARSNQVNLFCQCILRSTH
jgi:predicted ATPase